jgi:hypothetical protein
MKEFKPVATPSERQRRLRIRRREDAKWRQLNLWVSVEVFKLLKEISRATGTPQRTVLHDLLINAQRGKKPARKRTERAESSPHPAHQLQLFPN